MSPPYDVIIVGAGVFGLSTAIELGEKGHNVLCIDAHEPPSPWSAANDLNKIVRVEYSDMITCKLACEAFRMWESHPLYRDCFLRTGRLTLSPFDPNSTRSVYENESLKNLQQLGFPQDIDIITDRESVKSRFPHFAHCKLPSSFHSIWNKDNGVGLSAKALRKAYTQAALYGVQFVFGDDGEAVELLDNAVRVKSGKVYQGEKLLVCCGAATSKLLPLDNQTRTWCSFVTHIQLTDQEYLRYRDMPIFFSAQYGYFFPPEAKSKRIKIVVTTKDGYALADDKFQPGKKITVPRYKADHPADSVPVEAEAEVRKVLDMMIPELANHPLVDCKTCWAADSCDAYFLIDEVPYPGYKGVYACTGDTSHAFKFLPNIGKHIYKRLYGGLDPELLNVWRWKKNPQFQGKGSSRLPRVHMDLSEAVFLPERKQPKL